MNLRSPLLVAIGLATVGCDGPDQHAPCAHRVDRGPRRRWVQLLARVYEVHPLRRPRCHGQMRILAFLTDPGRRAEVRRDPRSAQAPTAASRIASAK